MHCQMNERGTRQHPARMRFASKKERYVPHEGRLLFMERRGRRRLAKDAERRGRVSSTPLRSYDTTPRRLTPVKSILPKCASAHSARSLRPLRFLYYLHRGTKRKRKVMRVYFIPRRSSHPDRREPCPAGCAPASSCRANGW